MSKENDLLPLLEYIDPATLDYQEWVNVGMALKEEGYSVDDWDNWSSKDSARYRSGECEIKWNGFNGNGNSKVTGGTIFHLAEEGGFEVPVFDGNKELDWNSEIQFDKDYRLVDKSWVQGKEITEPKDNWKPIEEVKKYLETLFEPEEYVGYLMEFYDFQDSSGKTIYKPKNKGQFTRTAGQIINDLNKYKEIGFALGDYNPEAGAYIRFNPLDGTGVEDVNVTNYKYALVESDKISIEKQNAIIRELELPVAALVYSGGKSIHAIVKIGATSFTEYKSRVEYLYKVCDKNGLEVDKQNKNASRFSRLPGVVRGKKKQFIIDTHIGKKDFEEWQLYIEELNDELPDFENLGDFENNIPDLAPELIKGVLRQGHKMLIAGPSKAGKSFALMELSIAIAEGSKWCGFDCAQGKVLYVNLELDRNSCINRFNDIYNALDLEVTNWKNIHIWNLRGKTVPMDKLAPKLVRRAIKENFAAIIIDPIYKVLTGDENSADQMAHFTNQFDKIATELGSSVIYCHHHSKGAQGGKKAMDRASGSGVFARDPDAIVDLVELEVTSDLREQQLNEALCEVYCKVIRKNNEKYYTSKITVDDTYSLTELKKHAKNSLNAVAESELRQEEKRVTEKVNNKSAWRIESTLREFPKFKPVNMWFDFPLHVKDKSGILADIILEEDKKPYQKGGEVTKKKTEAETETKLNDFILAYENLKSFSETGEVTVQGMMNYFQVSKQTIYNRLNKLKDTFSYDDGIIKHINS